MDAEYTAIAQGAASGEGDKPPYSSSPNGMAFSVGLWAKANGIQPLLVHASRGYSWILNERVKLDFQDDMENPKVSSV